MTVPGEGYRFDGPKAAPTQARTVAAGPAPAASGSGDPITPDYGAPVEKAFVGRGDEGIPDPETALRQSPRDGGIPNWQYYICYIHNLLARWEKAIEW